MKNFLLKKTTIISIAVWCFCFMILMVISCTSYSADEDYVPNELTDNFTEDSNQDDINDRPNNQPVACEYDYGAWDITKDATCTTPGSRKHICNKCNHEETEEIAQKAHDYNHEVIVPNCTTPGYTLHSCKNCNDEYQDSPTTALGHDWSSWETIKEPTTETTGEEQRHCQRPNCTAVEKHEIDKLSEPEFVLTIDYLQNTTWIDSNNDYKIIFMSNNQYIINDYATGTWKIDANNIVLHNTNLSGLDGKDYILVYNHNAKTLTTDKLFNSTNTFAFVLQTI